MSLIEKKVRVKIFGSGFILKIVMKIVVNNKFGIVWIKFKINWVGLYKNVLVNILFVVNSVSGIVKIVFKVVLIIVICIVFNIVVVIIWK